MSVLTRKLLRDLRGSWALLGAVASILAIGVTCYVALNSAHRNLRVAQQRYYVQCRMADFSLEFKKAPLAELAQLAELPGVVEIQPRIQFLATVDLPETVEPLNGQVVSLPDERTPTINDVVLVRGGYFTDRRANEVLVNDAFARAHHLHPGQFVHLLLNNRSQELFIVGTAISSEFTYLLSPGSIIPDARRFGVFYLKRSYAEEVFDMQGAANQVIGLLSPEVREQPDDLLRRAERRLESYGALAPTPRRIQPSHMYLDNEIRQLGAFGKIMPGIFVSVAAVILNVLLARLTDQQRTIIGTLKALGYGSGEILWHYVQVGLSVGLSGGLIGCVLGWQLAGAMTGVYRHFFQFPQLTNYVFPETWLAGALLGLGCGLCGAALGARRVLSLQPAEAMRPAPPAAGGGVWLERWTWFWRQLTFSWRMSLRTVLRNRRRTLAGVFAAAMGSALLVNALMMQASIKYLIDFQYRFVQRSDVDLTFKETRGWEALSEARHLPGVDLAEPALDVACTFVNGHHRRQGGVTGLLPTATLTIPRTQDERALRVRPAGLTLSRKLADLLDLRPGDPVRLEISQGLRQVVHVPVVEIADTYLGLSAYADLHWLSRLINEEFALTRVQLAVEADPAARAALYRELKRLPAVQSIDSRSHTIANLEDTLIRNQKFFITILVLFAGAMFFGSVLNASLVSLAERRREVATLQVLGYTPREIGGFFLRESTLVNLAGAIVGIPLGYVLSWRVASTQDTELFRIPLILPTWIPFAAVLLGTAFGLCAHLFVQLAILRMDWLDALKVKE